MAEEPPKFSGRLKAPCYPLHSHRRGWPNAARRRPPSYCGQRRQAKPHQKANPAAGANFHRPDSNNRPKDYLKPPKVPAHSPNAAPILKNYRPAAPHTTASQPPPACKNQPEPSALLPARRHLPRKKSRQSKPPLVKSASSHTLPFF